MGNKFSKHLSKFPLRILFIVFALFFISCRTTRVTSNDTSSEFYSKYSKTLGVKLTGDEDKKLIKAFADWLGTPYQYGGRTKNGTDCSGFVSTLYKELYNISLYRSAAEIVKNCDLINIKDIKTGDLVFFKINSENVSHVGIYIKDGKFIHASSSKAVMVSDLKENYWTKYFYSAGRIKNLK
jgi:probable lipoprotein NlpC